MFVGPLKALPDEPKGDAVVVDLAHEHPILFWSKKSYLDLLNGELR